MLARDQFQISKMRPFSRRPKCCFGDIYDIVLQNWIRYFQTCSGVTNQNHISRTWEKHPKLRDDQLFDSKCGSGFL